MRELSRKKNDDISPQTLQQNGLKMFTKTEKNREKEKYIFEEWDANQLNI